MPLVRTGGEVGMTRDEIIKGLEKEIRRIHREPKRKMLGIFMTVDEAEDIVVLLKEQEPVSPIRMHHTEHKETDNYRCGKCGDDMYFEQRFCGSCGQAAKWEQEKFEP